MAGIDCLSQAKNLREAIVADQVAGTDEAHQSLVHFLNEFVSAYNNSYPNALNHQDVMSKFYYNPSGRHNNCTMQVLALVSQILNH